MKFHFTAAVALTASILATQVASAQTTITFRYNDPDANVIEAAIADFETQNPDIDVELERLSWADARTQFLREAATGAGPDVLHLAFVWTLEMGAAGALLPLNDLLSQSGAGEDFAGNFIAADLATSTDGQIFGLPWTADTNALVYNPEVLAEAGVDAPQTWDELAAASAQVAERTGKIGFGFAAGGGSGNQLWFLVNYHLWSNGNAFVVEDGNGGYKVGVDVPTLAATIQYYADFMDAGGNPRANLASSGAGDLASLQPLVEGKQAMSLMTPTILQALVDAYREQTGEATTPFISTKVPTGSVGGISHLGGRMLGINANTEHADAAYRFVQFLSSQQFFADHLTSQFPAQRSALAALVFAPGFEGFAEQLPNARSWGAYATNGKTPIGAMWDNVGREMASVLVGDKTAEQAAQSIIDGINAMLAS